MDRIPYDILKHKKQSIPIIIEITLVFAIRFIVTAAFISFLLIFRYPLVRALDIKSFDSSDCLILSYLFHD